MRDNPVKFGKRVEMTTEPPTPWWASMTSLLYIAVNFALIYVFLLWPVQQGAAPTLKSIIIWIVSTVFAALVFLYARRARIRSDEK